MWKPTPLWNSRGTRRLQDGESCGKAKRALFTFICCSAKIRNNARSKTSAGRFIVTRAAGAKCVAWTLKRAHLSEERRSLMVVAVYPGTFDPLTRGHEDLVRRASSIFDTLVVGVADSRNKKPFFTLEERLDIAHEVLGHYPNVQVMSFKGLLKDFVRSNNARVIVRGLRAVSDFEYEFQMAGMNRYLLPDVETMFMTPSDQYQFISGTIVREIAQLGGDVSKFVFPSVEKWLMEKVAALDPDGGASAAQP